jgi:hypothetical protein
MKSVSRQIEQYAERQFVYREHDPYAFICHSTFLSGINNSIMPTKQLVSDAVANDSDVESKRDIWVMTDGRRLALY